jgi:periplasmic protein TonB
MFNDTTARSVSVSQPRRWLAGVFSVFSHGLVVGVVVAVTFARSSSLFVTPPCSEFETTRLTFRFPSSPPSSLPSSNESSPVVAFPGLSSVTGTLDLHAADHEGDDDASDSSTSGITPGVEGGICGCGVHGGIVQGLELVSLPPLSTELPPLRSRALRAGDGAPIPMKLVDVLPTYPPLARHARIEGVVVLDATIDEMGQVVDVRVLRSIALLDRAAIEAVRRWRYAPAMVNGQATPVVLTVTASFVL